MPIHTPEPLHEDPRLAWISDQILGCMSTIGKDSVLDLLKNGVSHSTGEPLPFDAAAIELFENEGSGALVIFAVQGDQFENPDRKEKRHRPYIQRLRFSQTGTPEDSTVSRSVQCVFFSKSALTSKPITAEDAANWDNLKHNMELNGNNGDTASIMDQTIDSMSCEAPSLIALQSMLHRVYLPLFEEIKATTPNPMLHSEVNGWVKRLGQQVGGLISQVSAERTLPMPATPIVIGESEADIKAAAANEEIVREVDAAVTMWHAEISATLRQSPQKEGPLGEIEFWKEKYSALSGLYEQVNSPKVRLILKVAQQAECNAWHAISGVLSQLTRQHNDAKDNVRFLGTLDRQFRTIHNVTPESGTLQPIIDVMASMMISLKVVWTLSRCYSTEEKMGGLLEKIAQLIAKKVVQHIDHHTILNQPTFDEARRKISEGQQVLYKWRAAYHNVASDTAQNPESGDVPWSFNQEMLFDRTDYIAERCTEYLQIVNILEYYNTVLGAQLKSVLKDTSEIEGILHELETTKKHVAALGFDPFEPGQVHHWHLVYTNFNNSVSALDQKVTQFIHNVFDRELRSAESAFELLQSFKSLNTRSGDHGLDIKKLLQTKSDRILQQFLLEIKRVEAIFITHKDNPPLTKNQPPIAGAIHWSSSLYQRLKKPILRFQDEGMLAKDSSEVADMVRAAYVELARLLKNYATGKYKDWKDEVATTVSECLRWKILKKVGDSDDVYTVNFNRNLFETIKEATYLDRLGFDVPPDALNVTLQDEAYHNYVESLQQMLTTFNHELATVVNSNEREIMLVRIQKLKDVLKPGVEDLNWLSLGIAEFIQKCNGEITEFRNFSRDIRKYVGILNTSVVQRIASTQLVPDLSHFTAGPQIMELQQVADEIERFRAERLEFCVRAYQSAPQSLKNIELLVEPNSAATTLGKSQLLARTLYYRHWEKRIHRAILKMVVNSLARFAALLGYQSKESRRRKSPLFRVLLSLSGADVQQSPPGHEIRNTVSKIVSGIINSSRSFCRWLNHTCIESSKGSFDAPPENMPLDAIYTFVTDIQDMPAVYKLQSFIQKHFIQSFTAFLTSYMTTIGDSRKAWADDNKGISVTEQNKFNYLWIDYYSKFRKFMAYIDGFDEEQKVDQIGFMLVDMSPLWTAYVDHVKDWLELEGAQLNDRVKVEALKLDARITAFAEELHKYDAESFDSLRTLLQIMDDATSQSLEIETKYRDIEFIYDALVKFRHKELHIPEEITLAYSLSGKWQAVLREVKTRNVSLAPKKVKFRRQTQQEVIQFSAEIKNSLGDFRRNGPSREGITLDESVQIKNEWRKKVDKMLAMRSSFSTAEKLLGLDISTYQQLQQLNEELGLVEYVLKLYEDWMVYQRKWSKLLWIEVRIEDMQRITDEKVKEARRMGKTHGQIMPFPGVQQHVQNFQASLPLLTKLKSPALKARHWKELMKQVGKQFNHEHITLEDLVNLELHDYPDEIDNVVLTAAREASVEKEIQTIKDFWASKEFVLSPYAPKGGVPRVSVLSDTSDIQEAVDDNILKISGLTNVKWVEPFIDEVRVWAKKLSMVNEVIGMWGGVQVQWQYLESIFMGSDDIAQQLPKETLKFKDLDRRWVRIMNDTVKEPNVEHACNEPTRLADLNNIKEKLDECQKDLTNYLLHKRDLFPRFFFISDDELLSILATSSAVSVQEHMLKMFDNSALLLFKDDSEIIEGVQSQEGEVLMFDQVVDPTNAQIEAWLQGVLDEGRRSLRGILKAAVFYYPKMDRLDWVNKYHGMVGLTGAKIWWTFQIEDAFAKIKKGRKTAVKDLLGKLSSQLDDLVTETAKDLPKLYRKKVNTLIIVDVHGRDIVDRFVRDSILEAREFDWESQLRYYWDKSIDSCSINQCTGRINYGFEYLGLNGRLVITPLTDRCWMTLTTALSYNLGGSPGGPAGTGKTESVKDLAKACGLHCLVTNCFTADTQVTLADGSTINICDVKVGQTVVTFDKTLQGYVTAPVAEVFNNGVREDLVRLTFSDGRTITCTPDHRFLLENGKLCKAKKLSVFGSVASAPAILFAPSDSQRASISTENNNNNNGLWSPSSLALGDKEKVHLVDRRAVAEAQTVYDIQVDHKDHNFLANGISAKNCGDGLDYRAMGTIFSGLSQAGSWGCFDEFNRIDLPVLSVVSEQLRRIQDALKRKVNRFMFEGREIALVHSTGVFITMNPGYAGRVELPDNLKALFRPVVMVVPDLELIAENMLFSEGFVTARELAKKMVTLYTLAKGQLSKQYHYDWGLRALKAVLVMAGALKRGSPELSEKTVLMRALRDMNAPKFVAEDEPLFRGLLSDLFPGLDPTRVPQENLSKASAKVLREHGLMIDARQVDKIVQLYETMQTRHTTMVVGPTGGGKSVVINTLKGAQDELRLPTKLYIINAKAQPTSVLYGFLDPMTRNWTDGIFSNVFRNINRVSKDGSERERKYVVFDGDVDAKWVEDLNSVMDDNRLLTLANGERIRLHPTCSLLYEVGDLQYASPATVSRSGMVYLDPTNLGWNPFVQSWLAKRSKDESEQVKELIEKYVPAILALLFDNFDEGTPVKPYKLILQTSDLNMCRQLCTVLQTTIPTKTGVPEPKVLECIFIFACVWSFGSFIATPADRERFDAFLKRITGWQTQDNGEQLERHISAGTLPERRTLYDYVFDTADQKFKPWLALRKPYEPPSNGKFNSILVSTEDTERAKWLLDRIIANRTPLMFIGESGTAKTVTIQSFLKELKSREKFVTEDGSMQLDEILLEMNFSSRTSGLDAQRTLEDNVEKKTSTVLGPATGKRLIVFVDDVNMPKVDLYGTQQPIAFLKLLLGQSGWYDRKDLTFKSVRDIQFLAAMAPPGGGRNALDPRFVSLFSVFNIPFPDSSSLRLIYYEILNGRLEEIGINLDNIAGKLTDMTLSLYQSIVDSMPATPKNFHYVFNLRDLSRVYQGLYRATTDKFSTEQSLLRLWRNETTRVFADRMAASEDKQKVKDFTDKLIIDNFPVSADHALQEPLLFGDFGDFETDSDKKRLHLYEDFGADFANVRKILDGILEEINTPVMKMDLVMFDMAIEHLLRIIRVINVSRGHCLLVGVGGSGKQSLAKLAAAVSEMSVFEIALSRGYGEESFREDLKILYNKCGVDNEQMVFLFMDMHVKQEGFLELINNMLASGMVPALFTEEEKEPLYAAVQQEVSAMGLHPSKDNLWGAFVNRCRDNLHIVLAMTPSGDVLRTRCRNFPSLINNTTIDWFTKWPAQALSAVAAKHLAQEDLPDYLRIPITEYFVFVHTVADEESIKYFNNLKRRNFVTPKNFLAFLANYSKLLTEKRQDIDEISFKLKTGLEKLHEASEEVATLSTELAEKEVDLAEKSRKNEEMLSETTELKEQNEVKMKEAQETEEELVVRNVEIEKDSAEANKVLEEAMPALREAQAALEHLDKSKIDELKAFAAPSEKVIAVAKMICVLLNADKVSWEAARSLMNQASFIPSVKGYPLETLTERKMREVATYVNSLANASIESMRSASVAAAELFRWVKALQEYWVVAKQVAPKKAKVQKLEEEKRAMEEKLTGIKNEIEFRNETVRSLTIRLEAGLEQARKLQEETAVMQRRLDAARRLINGFTSERKRWHEEMDSLKDSRTRLVGDCLLGAAFMSYLGAFTFSYRNDTLFENWLPELKRRNVPLTEQFSVKKLFTNEVQLSQWASNGLPMDELSVMNGILTVESTRGSSATTAKDKKATAANTKKAGKIRFPLCIDPQKQAVNWIKRTHADNSRFEVATFSDPDFLKRLEFCIQYGIPFLFENVDEFIDPIVDAVLDPQFRYESGQKMIKIGDKDIAWDDNFKLYLCTKLSNPNYTAEVFGKTLVINYSVTQDGLESQLLNEVVAIERVSLQTQSEELVQTMAENRAQLKQLEESLIRELTLATGNILDNDELIETLENTKSSASDVTAKLQQAEQMAEETERSRQEYRPVARRGAILFFVMAQLSAINSMYEYALSAFLNDVFKHSILKSENAFETKDRLHNIIEYLTFTVYKYVCMGIFEKHKLTFALQMTIRLMYDIDSLPPAEVDFFIRGCVLPSKDYPDNYSQGLLTDGQWNDICKLAVDIEVFHKLTDEVRENLQEWVDWCALDRPEGTDVQLPCGYSERLSPFQRLCLLRCFRPDRVFIAVSYFISSCELMGEKFTIPPILKYSEVFKQSSCLSPIVCVVSPGANPTDEIAKLAEKVFGSEHVDAKLKSVSLGQGQDVYAMHLFEQGATRGWWVLLANAHLMTSFMKDLEKAIEKRDGENAPHGEFRLWITSEPSVDFPLGILQRSLKVVNEPPNGLKMNMKNTLSRVTEADLEECSHPAFRPLVYTLAFFHAVVQERRKYGKIGWNVIYDFNETDFGISMKLARTYLEKAVAVNDPIPWDTLRYLTGEAMYGGRVTDNFDRRIVKCYLEEYFGDFLFDTFQPFHFFQDAKVDYCLPDGSTDLENPITRDDMAGHIEKMPLENQPDVFGLHPNAETGYLRSAAESMWATLKELMPRATVEAATGGSGGEDNTLTLLAKEILDKIPTPFDRKAVLKQQLEHCRLKKQDGLQPTQVVLMQEIERWNNLVTVMVATLNLLQKALAGIIGMSAELDDLAVSLSNGTLPAQWRKLAPSTRKSLGRWLVHFQRRHEQFKRWIEIGEPPCLWLSGIMIPEAYISALVQITCRKYVWPLDKSTIFTRVTTFENPDEITEPPKDGAYVCGLFLEGARYDMTKGMLETQEKKVLIRELPILEIIPQESSKVKLVSTFRTPVYVTRDRRNAAGVGMVFEADLASDQHYSHWVLESVALILNSDD